MPDLVMCANIDCKIKDKCRRYTNIAKLDQIRASYIPLSDTSCNHFVEIKTSTYNGG